MSGTTMAPPERRTRVDGASIDAALDRLERLGGAPLVEKMIATFVDHAARTVGRAHAALAAQDPDGIERAAHSLKSSAANVGATELCELARSVERLAGAPHGKLEASGELSDLVKRLPAALGEVCRYLETKDFGT